MTLSSSLAEWKNKKAEAERELAKNSLTASESSAWAVRSRTAGENIARIESILAVRPETDEVEAEIQRHSKAMDSIYARHQK